jgi:DNA-binding HxlR family transcriptional regulator
MEDKMKYYKFFLCLSVIILLNSGLIEPAITQNNKEEDFPEFEFETWGSAPSRDVYKLTNEKPVQKILFAIKDNMLSIEEIGAKTGEAEPLVLEKLKELKKYNLVSEEEEKWISNIPLYTEKELMEAEKVGLRYAEIEAEILRNAIPGLKKTYEKTAVSRYFSWNEVSLIIVGALLADFCVFDRIPFRPENYSEDLQPQMEKPDGGKWQYTGYEILPKSASSRKWRFYQNVSEQEKGATSMFGYLESRRKQSTSQPLEISFEVMRTVLIAFADGSLSFTEIQKQTGLEEDILQKALKGLENFSPPAVVLKDGKYHSQIPIFSESDFDMLVCECDKVAEDIFKNAVLPFNEKLKERAKELSYRWPLPKRQFVRDKALQMLIEEGLIGPFQESPVDWNFAVWGWKGNLLMWEEVAKNNN